MSVVGDIKKLEVSDFALGTSVLVVLICPGFLTLYLYRPDLIQDLETAKIIVFSFALTVPILILNLLFLALASEFADSDYFARVQIK